VPHPRIHPQASVIAESHRLSAYIDSCAAAVSRVQYPYDPLRQRMAKAGIPWDTQLLTDLRWASQRAAVALMQHALDWREDIVRWGAGLCGGGLGRGGGLLAASPESSDFGVKAPQAAAPSPAPSPFFRRSIAAPLPSKRTLSLSLTHTHT
jgi:hypothetical protein